MYRIKKPIALAIVILCSAYNMAFSQLVGYTNVQAGVGENGQAISSIKLNLPKGSVLQPSLTITYNSQGGNSLCGEGFSIDGIFQVISRVPSTYEQDGFSTGKANDPFSGRYSLNGERLMATFGYSNKTSGPVQDCYLYNSNATNSNWNGGFRTEQESFSRIVVYTSEKTQQLNDPNYYADSFRVYTKDGLILDFGCTANSRIEKPGTALTINWLLCRITDRNGNFILVDYQKNANAEFFPTQILYSGNIIGNTAPYARIAFTYESRPDSSYKYTNGYSFRTTQRVKEIICYDRNSLYRKYALQYAIDTLKSKLVSITEYGSDGTSFLKPVKFVWKQQPITPGFTDESYWNGHAGGLVSNIQADFDGNGKTDIAGHAGGGLWHVSLSSGSNFSNSYWQAPVATAANHLIGDFNGDGKSDIAAYSGGRWQVGISTGKKFNNADWNGTYTGTNISKYYACDINGDGLSDIICYSGAGNWHSYISTGSSFLHSSFSDGCTSCDGNVLIGDFDGDGKADFINSPFVSSIIGTTVPYCLTGDFNGDGLTDLATFLGNSNWRVALSKGSNGPFTFSVVTWKAHNGGLNNNFTGDFNKDGITDLVAYIGSGNWQVFIGTGRGFKGAAVWRGHTGGNNDNFVGDFNGDGATDLMGYAGGGLWDVARSNAQPELLSEVINGNGARTTFSYAPITDNNVYKQDSTGLYPNIDFCAPLYIVSSIKTDDGTGNVRSVYYKYAHAKLNTLGRGFRGFGMRIVTDSLANSILTTWYNTDHKYILVRPIRSELRTLNNLLLQKTERSIAFRSTRFTKDSIFSSYYTSEIDSVFDNGVFYSSKVTNYQYDDWGNTTQTVETANNGYKIVIDNIYENTPANWQLGKLISSTITKQMPGKPASKKQSLFSYNSNGMLIREVFMPSSSIFRLQKDYSYDLFGNCTMTNLSGPSFATRSSISVFDIDGRFQLQSKNPLGHVQRMVYRNGLPDSVIDANGRVMRFVRDPFGREAVVQYPDGTSKTIEYSNCSSTTCPANAVYSIKEKTTGRPYKIEYYDLFDRIIRRENESFKGINVIVDFIFNRDGTLSRESEPYFKGATSLLWNQYFYDPFKRVVSKVEPGGKTTSFSYSGLVTTVTNPELYVTKKIKNQQGKVTQVIDENGSTLNFDYDSELNIISTIGPKGLFISYEYDSIGNRIVVNDPNMGRYRYFYNALGLLTKQINPAGEIIENSYDLLNRQTQRKEPEGLTEWKYDATNAIGGIEQISNRTERHTYKYNTKGRPEYEEYLRDGSKKVFKYSYNASGLLETLTYPNNSIIKYNYNSTGFATSIQLLNIRNSPVTIWTANNYNEHNQVVSATLGNGLAVTRTFDEHNNLVALKAMGNAASQMIQNLHYSYSANGNLVERRDLQFGLYENFLYDKLNRLVQCSVNGQQLQKIEYDVLGNIIYKTGVGKFHYGEGGQGPNMLTSIEADVDSCVYAFNHLVRYTSYNYISYISNGSSEVTMGYGPERERQSMVTRKGGRVSLSKNYFGSLYEETVDEKGLVTWNYYIRNGNETVAVVCGLSTDNPTERKDSILYLHTDHVGSVYAYTDEYGKAKEYFSYDAWGRPRNPFTWQTYPVTQPLSAFQKGYTYHEMLDFDFLVFMNARVYNPVLGRFLSPDPFIQNPEDLQSYNRYSYVLNNPLTYTDPSGYFSFKKFLKHWGGIIVGAAITAASGGTLGGAFIAGLTGSSAFGAVAGTVFSGALSGFGSAFTTGILNGQGLGSSLLLGLHAGIQTIPLNVQGMMMEVLNVGLTNMFPSWIETNPNSLNQDWNVYRRVGSQLANSGIRSLANGFLGEINGKGFRKSFLNSISWEGVGFANEIMLSNFNRIPSDQPEEYQYGRPSFKKGNGLSVYGSDNKYGFLTSFRHQNAGGDWNLGRAVSWSTVGSPSMNAINDLVPGINYHANVHDTYISVLFSTFQIQSSYLTMPINLITELPFAYINYGVNLNYHGLSNNK